MGDPLEQILTVINNVPERDYENYTKEELEVEIELLQDVISEIWEIARSKK